MKASSVHPIRRAKWFALHLVPGENAPPRFVRRLGEPEKLSILRVNGTFFDQEIRIECLAPVGLANQNDGHRGHLSRLRQFQNLEQLVQGAVAARESDQRSGTQREVQLSNREIAKFEAQFGTDIGIGKLFVWQADIEAYGLRAHIAGAAIRGLHDPRTATCHDENRAGVRSRCGSSDEPAKLPRYLVILAFDAKPLCDRAALSE